MTFTVGCYYRWVGPADFNDNWNSDMEHWKDGKARRCLSAVDDLGVERSYASFEDILHGYWRYSHIPNRYFARVLDAGPSSSSTEHEDKDTQVQIDISSLSRKHRRATALDGLSIE